MDVWWIHGWTTALGNMKWIINHPPAGPPPTIPQRVKESRTGVSIPRLRFVAVPSRFGLIEESASGGEAAAAAAAAAEEEEVKQQPVGAAVGGTLRLRLLGVGPRCVRAS
jgi:hypothetical protein